jgi:hypothetical protein
MEGRWRSRRWASEGGGESTMKDPLTREGGAAAGGAEDALLLIMAG